MLLNMTSHSHSIFPHPGGSSQQERGEYKFTYSLHDKKPKIAMHLTSVLNLKSLHIVIYVLC